MTKFVTTQSVGNNWIVVKGNTEMTGTATEIWSGDYCFRVDHSAEKYGRETRRVYRLVGFEKFHSISYDPDRPTAFDHPWSTCKGSCRTGSRAADVTILQLLREIAEARNLIAAADAHKAKARPQ